jgi:hypothetical protein
MGYSFVRCQNLNTSECRSEVPRQVINVVLEKDGEEQLGRKCEKNEKYYRVQEKRNILQNNKKKEC